MIEITKACIVAFMKARKRGEKKKIVKMYPFKFPAKSFFFFVNMEKVFMADLLPNGLHERVMICSICYITKSRLDVQFVKKISLEMVNR